MYFHAAYRDIEMKEIELSRHAQTISAVRFTETVDLFQLML